MLNARDRVGRQALWDFHGTDSHHGFTLVIPRIDDLAVMAQKRKLDATSPGNIDSPSKRFQSERRNGEEAGGDYEGQVGHDSQQTPTKTTRSGRAVKLTEKLRATGQGKSIAEQDIDEAGSPTPRANGISLVITPRKERTPKASPSKTRRADLSAKRKSARAIATVQEEEDWEGQGALAKAILDEEEEEHDDAGEDGAQDGEDELNEAATPSATPSKRGRGRPKQPPRSPTPDGDIAPEERYFFQNRPGLPKISSNTMASVKLLSHDECFEQLRSYEDPHKSEKAYLTRLHARAFPQWQFELQQNFSLCLYGYGSKRSLANKFMEWLHSKLQPHPRIVVVNGYNRKCGIKAILSTLALAVNRDDEGLKLIGQPQEMLEKLLSYLDSHSSGHQIVLLVNSIDSPSLRRNSVQTILARLSQYRNVNLVVTMDTPTSLLTWNSSLSDQFQFIFHDCTTFAAYDAEINIVDEVHDLLGRKGRRIGGKEGIGFVLKSLPENARNLYRVLLAEILAILSDAVGDLDDVDDDDNETRTPKKKALGEVTEEVGIEYRALYQKASEEFICSSDMNFRFLLKEFHDHQMITSRRDASGTELLSVPLLKEDMEAVLEDLVLD